MARAQEAVEGMVIKRVEVCGLETISEAYVRRVIKTREGQPFRRAQVEEDVRELLRTRRFLNAFAATAVEENQAVVVFTVQEKPELVSVELEGNKAFPDDQLFALTPAAGDVIDMYEVRRGQDEILRKYREAGYYYVEVTFDERALQYEGRLIYRINEGPKVRVRQILFEGNRSFPDWRLRSKVQTRTALWIFRVGAFDAETAERDAIEIQRFYRDEGFLDARAGYRLEFDEVTRADLTVVFVIEEGQRYCIQDIVVEGNTVFSAEHIRSCMQLEPGYLLRTEAVEEDRKRVQDLYGEVGYVDARVAIDHEFLEEPGLVILRVSIIENKQYYFGRIIIRGNQRTKDEVVRRELQFYPGELWNTVEARAAEQRLRETGLFQPDQVRITPLPPEDSTRPALVEVQEAETVTFLVGIGVSTDAGAIGSLTVENRNFDLFDWPRTWGQFFRGQAFRGDGQRLKFSAEPGTEVSRFRIDFTEPYLLDRPVRLDTSLYLFERGRDGYDEERAGFMFALSKRFPRGLLAGWAVEGAFRVEGVGVDDVDALASRQIKEVRGDNLLTTVKGTIVRDTTDSRVIPSKGYRFTLSWEQAGALGGDFDFGRPTAGIAWYKTLRTDIFDRKSVLALHADTGMIVGDAPVFERFYAGGFGSLRGFSYRGISPRAGIMKNKVGGDFIFLTGAEYSFPLYGKNFRGVTFLDMGTVEENVTITTWRAAVGVGLRINVDFFGPVPIVLDFGFPIADDDQDDTQVFNFAFGASF
ncbi:MAG TPA: outer membrane protein assembly factor BamA [Phycisphaerae bacterium]|nr:outer membrane protein assembly factor BamA [Phycisphaerae bacterium]